jgi:hypothetical protein
MTLKKRPAVWIALALLACASISLAQKPGGCPPVLASLMPKDAVKVAGRYNSAGMIGLGFAAGELPYDNPCTNAVTKTPGHISVDVKHYDGEGVQLFKMQIDSVEAQMLQDKRAAFEKECAKLRAAKPGPVKMSGLKSESVAGGTLLYYDYYIDCSEGTPRSHPDVQLLGVAHTESTGLTIEINGFISAEAAKAAAVEVLGNFRKADFGRAAQGK